MPPRRFGLKLNPVEDKRDVYLNDAVAEPPVAHDKATLMLLVYYAHASR